MAHYVNGVREAAARVPFGPLGAGGTSIGVRQNRVSWYKGRIRSIRITPEALPPARMLPPPRHDAARWFRTAGYDAASPIPKPAGEAVPHGQPLSDDFATNKMGIQWSFYDGTSSPFSTAPMAARGIGKYRALP
jgi:hypothetical protein